MNIGVTRKLETTHTRLKVDPATDRVILTEKNDGVVDQNGKPIPPQDYVLLRGDGIIHFGRIQETTSPVTGKQIETAIHEKGRFSFGENDFFYHSNPDEHSEWVNSPGADPKESYSSMVWSGNKPVFHYDKTGRADSYVVQGERPGTLDWVQITRHETGTHIGRKHPELN